MTIQEIKDALQKKATVFETGGIRPTNGLLENWIGKVTWKGENESLPLDVNGNEMQPLATLFLDGLTGVPKGLKDTFLCTVFISPDFLDNLMDLEGYFMVRTYNKNDKLVQCSWINENIKALPLVPIAVENDFPVWDGGGIPSEIEDEILRLEDEEDIDYYEDIAEENYTTHKIGGYPAYIQSGDWDTDLYEFAFQISSDEKAKLNIADSGSFYFFYSKEKQKWDMQCDFF